MTNKQTIYADDVYAHEHESMFVLGNPFIECSIDLSQSGCLRMILNKCTGKRFEFHQQQDISLRLATDTFRHNISRWRFHPGSPDAVKAEEETGFKQGFYQQTFDDNHWIGESQLNVFPIGARNYQEIVYPGYGWYRTSFPLPVEMQGRPIELGLGGYDGSDWKHYRIYINGVLAGESSSEKYWHEAPRYVLTPENMAYNALRFGQDNVLAVQACGLDRRFPEMKISDAERYKITSHLVDQYISDGPAYKEVEDFEIADCQHHFTADSATLEFEVTSQSTKIDLRVKYWVTDTEPVIYKQIEVRNASSSKLTLLEIDLQNLTGDYPVSLGGIGVPCTIEDELFCAIQHPSGIVKGKSTDICMQCLPGLMLDSDHKYVSKPLVFGAGVAGKAGQAFVRHLERHSLRNRKLLHLYDLFGSWTEDDCGGKWSDLTEKITLDNLAQIEKLQKRDVRFDYYFIDAGWNNPQGDWTDFDPQRFCNGPQKIVRRIEALGMKFGLWFSPHMGPMVFHPEVQHRAIDHCAMRPFKEDEDEPCTTYCLAAPIYKSMLKNALLYHIQHNNVKAFKLDGISYFCTCCDHEHLPGKYAFESIVDAMIDVIGSAYAACPELMTMYYTDFQSPWWLLHGHSIYDRGLWMEGATPSDIPTRHIRQSITTAFDQAVDFSWDLLPLTSQDSLGIWLSNTPWGGWMGKHGWQDAWMMDVARGSMLCQLWGDLRLLDKEDVAFAAFISSWARANANLLACVPRRINNSWEAKPYGYIYADGDRGVIFLYNPTFASQQVQINATEIFEISSQNSSTQTRLTCRYPPSKKDHTLNQDPQNTFCISLDPFEVQMRTTLFGHEQTKDTACHTESFSIPIRTSSARLACNFEEISCSRIPFDRADLPLGVMQAINGRAKSSDDGTDRYAMTDISRANGLDIQTYSNGRDNVILHRHLSAQIDLSETIFSNNCSENNDTLFVIAQPFRDKIHWHNNALYDIIQLKAHVVDRPLLVRCTPNRWHEQAGSWGWMVFEIDLPESNPSKIITLEADVYLPKSVTLVWHSWLFQM